MATSAELAAASAAGIVNVSAIATAADLAGLPFPAALAQIQMESGGANIYGHDIGGVFSLPSGQRLEVTEANFEVFLISVMAGATSNGVGPCQITYAGTLKAGKRDGGYFTQMIARGLKPWEPVDSCRFGFELMAANHARYGTWESAGSHYNGGTIPGPRALAYGARFAALVTEWTTRLNALQGDPMPKVKPPNVPMIPARHSGGSQTPRAVVMHGTVSSDNAGTARSIAKWWNGPTSPVTSAHYVVDPNEAIQCVGDHTVAYHCGHNTGSVAVELCDEEQGPASRWADADSKAIIARAATLVAQLCLAYGIEIRRPSVAELRSKGPHGIYGHNDSRLAFGNTTHSDPIDFPWGEFISAVKAEANRLTGKTPSKPITPPEDDMPAYSDWSQKDKDALSADVAKKVAAIPVANKETNAVDRAGTLSGMVTRVDQNVDTLTQQVADLTALVQSLGKSQGA